MNVSFSKIEKSFLLILRIIVEAFNAAEPLFLSSSFCQGRWERGIGKELKLVGNNFSSCLGGNAQKLVKLPSTDSLEGQILKQMKQALESPGGC